MDGVRKIKTKSNFNMFKNQQDSGFQLNLFSNQNENDSDSD